ncbi:MAG: acetate kinase, partial [Candidatus Omnitrophica bacterium]|nr:acetate kinase [Candidatus Omnitrophota bacterium]
QKIISCHLGSGGSSVCAIKFGKSVNTSMGFTPLEGLIMNTRSGSIDAGVIFYIMFKEKFSSQEAERILNKKSGILGIFDFSSDLRDVIDGVSNNPKAKIAFNMYIKRVKKYIGSYSLILNKADILIFTDSIGTKVPVVRRKICKGMGIFGIDLDKNKNYHYSSGIADISCGNSQTRILVVPTDEELMIAREVYEAVSDGSIS